MAFDCLLFVTAYACINVLKCKKFLFFKKYIIVLHYHCQSQKIKTYTNSALDLQNVSENFGAEVLNTLNSVKNILNMSHSELCTHETKRTTTREM